MPQLQARHVPNALTPEAKRKTDDAKAKALAKKQAKEARKKYLAAQFNDPAVKLCAPWAWADTLEHFAEYINQSKSTVRGLQFWEADKALQNVLADAHTKAVALARKVSLPEPLQPPANVENLSECEKYLDALRSWASDGQTIATPGEKLTAFFDSGHDETEGEWSEQMPLSAYARAIKETEETTKSTLARTGLKQKTRQNWTARVDNLRVDWFDEICAMRKKLRENRRKTPGHSKSLPATPGH